MVALSKSPLTFESGLLAFVRTSSYCLFNFTVSNTFVDAVTNILALWADNISLIEFGPSLSALKIVAIVEFIHSKYTFGQQKSMRSWVIVNQMDDRICKINYLHGNICIKVLRDIAWYYFCLFWLFK